MFTSRGVDLSVRVKTSFLFSLATVAGFEFPERFHFSNRGINFFLFYPPEEFEKLRNNV